MGGWSFCSAARTGDRRHLKTTAMARRRSTDTYHVAVTQSGHAPARWQWEIFRNGLPLPIRLRGEPFHSEHTARAAGNVALREFLEALANEQNP